MHPSADAPWFATPFSFANLAARHVLVLGLGGGADIVTAYAVSRLLPEAPDRRTTYGNTKKHADGSLEPISPHLHRLGCSPTPTEQRRGHGTTRIDQAVPRGPDDCPYIVLLPDAADEAVVASELAALGCDLILGIDTGGDSIVGSATSGDDGRDKRMLRVLRHTGLPALLLVVAPGSDGESSSSEMQAAVQGAIDAGHYRGCFSLEPVLGVFRSLMGVLGPTRTPRIILDAADGKLRTVGTSVIVPRGCHPAVPPRWLTHGFVFTLPAG